MTIVPLRELTWSGFISDDRDTFLDQYHVAWDFLRDFSRWLKLEYDPNMLQNLVYAHLDIDINCVFLYNHIISPSFGVSQSLLNKENVLYGFTIASCFSQNKILLTGVSRVSVPQRAADVHWPGTRWRRERPHKGKMKDQCGYIYIYIFGTHETNITAEIRKLLYSFYLC